MYMYVRNQSLDSNISKENMKMDADNIKKVTEDIATPKTISLNQNNILNKYIEYSTPDKRIFANAETLCKYHDFLLQNNYF